jgi:hypothetical protein
VQEPHRNSSGVNSEGQLLLGNDTDGMAILFAALSDNILKDLN